MTTAAQQKVLDELALRGEEIRTGEAATKRRDVLYLRGRRLGISLADLGAAAGAKPNAVKFSLREIRRKKAPGKESAAA